MTMASGAGELAQLAAYKNDAQLAHSVIRRTVGSTAEGTGALHFDVTLSTNDYVELWCVNSATKNITMTAAYMFLMSMIT